jgi:5-methylcytosine-specific restriction protein A
MNLTDAIAAVLADLNDSASTRDIADHIWDRFEEFRDTPAQLSSKRYSEPVDALRAAVATTVKKSRRFTQDRTGSVIRVSLSEGTALWADEELRASVTAYLEMRSLALAGQPFVKKAYYSDLSEKFGRTPSAYEFRMQNISAILSAQGRYWIPGLPPAKNVGSNVFAKIIEILVTVEGHAYEAIIQPAGDALMVQPAGNQKPESRKAEVTRFNRDQQVRDWVLKNAKGVCEGCNAPAPFVSVAGPFLEVHHLRRLADGGSDTITNALALCPNCHRRLHYALDAPVAIEAMYRKLARLRRDDVF